MTSPLGPELKDHFDELAQEAPHAPDALVATARSRGDRRRRQAAMGAGTGVVVLAFVVGLGVTQPWSRSTDTHTASPGNSDSSTDSSTTGTADQHLAGSSWRLMRQTTGGREVEQYDTIGALIAAAPLLARGTVTDVHLGALIDDPQMDQSYRDLLLTITPSEAVGPAAAAATSSIVVQLGPFFGSEPEQWVKQMSTGPTSLIGDEAVWALRPREDAQTYRPLTSDSVFVRDGDRVLVPLTAETPLSQEIGSISWVQLVAAADLDR